ncbi:MAG: flagellar motor stator protein MotA [Deltaproteobacteria bacterium]|nr:flagellar motor stator protein MotA [Deltaproteobacteria bacterium]
MYPIIGIIVVYGAIIWGYILEKGNLYVLLQPAEFIIISGAALGSMLIMCSPSTIAKIIKAIPTVIIGKGRDKKDYLALLGLLYSIFSKIKKEGLLAIEQDIEAPQKSGLFKKYPEILGNHHATNFICDNLRVFVVGIKPMEMEGMMDVELDAHHEENAIPTGVIMKVADSLPGFGIVAAVLGVVITMGKMAEPPEVIGHSVAAALVGTFLGILLCYGLLGPIGNHIELKTKEDSKYLEAIKTAILSFAKDMPPNMAVEAARRVLFSDFKPTFQELENSLKKSKELKTP